MYEADLVDVLSERVIDGGVPFLGICIGLQVPLRIKSSSWCRCGTCIHLRWVPAVNNGLH